MRWMIAVALVAMTACQTEELGTSSIEQAVNDCTPGGNFPGAKLPQMSWWNGKTPVATAGQMYIDYRDPTVKGGRNLAFIVDPGKGQIVWGAVVLDKDLPAYRASAPASREPRIGDCCRPPPPPPGGGTDWLARFTLEAALRYQEVPEEAAAAAGQK